ncbi:hypothetical protein C8F01DRAFT_1194156 [Mycena amicta]|nr:hypothetical protein C8F01DRAFT_1194156 [Mycena amicta]
MPPKKKKASAAKPKKKASAPAAVSDSDSYDSDDSATDESEMEDLDVVDTLKQLIGFPDALRSFCQRHKDYDFPKIDKENKQLTRILRKLLKPNATLKTNDFRIIATTASRRRRRTATQRARPLPVVSQNATVEANMLVALDATRTSAGNSHSFLRWLGLMDEGLRREFLIAESPITYADAKHKRSQSYRSVPLQVYGTFAALTHPPERKPFTLALLAFPCSASLLGMTAAEAELVEWHSNVAVVIDNPSGDRRDLLLFEPNVTPIEAASHDMAVIFQPWLAAILRRKNIRKRFGQIWVNDACEEINDTGICLSLALEWMFEVVSKGLTIKRDSEGRVVAVRGFRRVVERRSGSVQML